MIIMKGLEEFRLTSGLAASIDKSTVFFCQVNQALKRAIMDVMPFEEGKLPVRYLGVPLISSNLIAANCKALIEKVDRRIDDWMNKALSFAGRLQLIVSVISSMFTYWASVLMLPASTVKELERKMKGFLWQKDEKDRAKSKERNARIFTDIKRRPTQIAKIILDTVRLKLVSMREVHVISNWKTRKRWDLERIVLHEA
ncbi:hypothetical protein QVD17_00329 [Tagetes erecta]|uniref:Reverse transcriptase n=1 Tax=Tagetes erecta TaxID=13708 RepID=A0AAD8P746_TARER|nr:hypothetical protein QVD17_00329 [Tagetes erecta]